MDAFDTDRVVNRVKGRKEAEAIIELCRELICKLSSSPAADVLSAFMETLEEYGSLSRKPVEANRKSTDIRKERDDLAMLLRRMLQAFRGPRSLRQQVACDSARKYLKRKGLDGSPLR